MDNTSLTNKKTEKILREILEREGFQMNPERKDGELGVDIRAVKGEVIFHIEVIGYKKNGPARAKDFFEVFFRAISRLNDGAKNLIIAFPNQWKNGLPRRAKQYGVAWRRIGEVFPELNIWLVDIEGKKYEESEWNEWLRK